MTIDYSIHSMYVCVLCVCNILIILTKVGMLCLVYSIDYLDSISKVVRLASYASHIQTCGLCE